MLTSAYLQQCSSIKISTYILVLSFKLLIPLFRLGCFTPHFWPIKYIGLKRDLYLIPPAKRLFYPKIVDFIPYSASISHIPPIYPQIFLFRPTGF